MPDNPIHSMSGSNLKTDIFSQLIDDCPQYVFHSFDLISHYQKGVWLVFDPEKHGLVCYIFKQEPLLKSVLQNIICVEDYISQCWQKAQTLPGN